MGKHEAEGGSRWHLREGLRQIARHPLITACVTAILLTSAAHMTVQGLPWAHWLLASVNLVWVLCLHGHVRARQQRALQQRIEQAQAAQQALVQAQAREDEFVAAVGHELRTPMNAILGFNGVLRRELADRPQDVQEVDHIRHATEQLLQVVNQILDFSQLQAAKVQLSPQDFDLPASLVERMARHERRARQKGLGWRLEGVDSIPVRVHMDRQRLMQMLDLLLDNAIRFTERGEVCVRVSQAAQHLRFEVQDTGAGIAPERQSRLFERFEPTHAQTAHAGSGTGLGLPICAQLARLFGGQIGVRSTPGQGSVFWLDLPFALARKASEGVDSTEQHAPSPQQILLVDDNAVNLMVARLQLQQTWPKARITTAASGAEALQLLDAQGFDLALVDMVMPEMDGPQLAQHIRQRFPAITARMPIIALTANTSASERARCLAAGMNDVLHKPMDTDSLLRCVAGQMRPPGSPS